MTTTKDSNNNNITLLKAGLSKRRVATILSNPRTPINNRVMAVSLNTARLRVTPNRDISPVLSPRPSTSNNLLSNNQVVVAGAWPV